MQSAHLNLQSCRRRRESEEVKAAQGRATKAIIRMATAPTRSEFDPWSTPPRHHEALASACETFVTMHMPRHHEQGFTRLHKGRHKDALDHAIVWCKGAVRI